MFYISVIVAFIIIVILILKLLLLQRGWGSPPLPRPHLWLAVTDVRQTGETRSRTNETTGQPVGHVASDVTRSVPRDAGPRVCVGESVSSQRGPTSGNRGLYRPQEFLLVHSYGTVLDRSVDIHLFTAFTRYGLDHAVDVHLVTAFHRYGFYHVVAVHLFITFPEYSSDML